MTEIRSGVHHTMAPPSAEEWEAGYPFAHPEGSSNSSLPASTDYQEGLESLQCEHVTLPTSFI